MLRPDCSLNFIPADDLQPAWTLILPGLKKIHERSASHWIPEDVYSACRTGHSHLYIGYVHGDYAGFLVLTPSQTWDAKVLHMWCVYNASEHDVMRIFEEDLNKLGRAIGARRLTFWSTRNGWEKVAGRYGFVQTQVEYVKEL